MQITSRTTLHSYSLTSIQKINETRRLSGTDSHNQQPSVSKWWGNQLVKFELLSRPIKLSWTNKTNIELLVMAVADLHISNERGARLLRASVKTRCSGVIRRKAHRWRQGGESSLSRPIWWEFGPKKMKILTEDQRFTFLSALYVQALVWGF